ncbi:MAG: glycosyltransferase family 1 protein [Chloroflexi bacterium]|nr:glycosyltransferase family 1 protein [Chloroflexota bacterium]
MSHQSCYDFIILSTQDWDALPTRKHRFARMWAAEGHRVLYVEQQMHWAGWLVDLSNQFSRAWRWLAGPRQVEQNLWVLTLPIVLPFFQMSGLINAINNVFLLPLIQMQARRLGFRHPILWTYTPHSADFIGKLGEQAAIYECVDDFTASKGLVNGAVIGRLERRLIEAVDLLIVTAAGLVEKKKTGARAVKLISNGVDVSHLAQAADPSYPAAEPVASLPRPIVGYLGTLNYWIDTGLLAHIARAHPDWTLLLVGPVDLLADMKPLEGLPNIVRTGRIPYTEVPAYVKVFDVCVNPYHLDEVAEHCSPLKLYEYIATGKPIISVDMPEARLFDGLVTIANDPEQFVAALEAALANDDGELAELRRQEALQHDWRRRFDAANDALNEVIHGR